MTEGRLRKVYPDGSLEASAGPEGWTSPSPDFADFLNTSYPTGNVVHCVGWVRAFYQAQKALGAEVIEAPVPDPSPDGTIH